MDSNTASSTPTAVEGDVVDTSAAAEEHNQAGNALFRQAKYMEAIRHYQKAIEADPKAKYWSNTAACYYNLQDWTQLKVAAEACIKVDPTFVKGYYRLAQAQQLVYEFAGAQQTIERAVELDPSCRDLLKLKHSNQEEIRERCHLKTEVLKLPERGYYDFFAGCDATQVPADSAYVRFPRPAVPPCAAKLLKEARADDSSVNEKVQHAIECFCAQDLRVKWVDNSTRDTSFLLEGYLPNDDKPVMVVDMASAEIGFHCIYKTQANQAYHRCLTFIHKEHFCYILLSRFLRNNGSKIDSILLRSMINYLLNQFEGQAMFKDALDTYLLWNDIRCGQGDLGIPEMVNFGERLEAAKEYKKAAEIYLDVAESKFGQSPLCTNGHIRGLAALAYKRDLDYVAAEREYIGSLREAGRDWNFSDDTVASRNLENMMIFYEVVQRMVHSGAITGSAYRTMQECCKTLVALLDAAGYDRNGCRLFESRSAVKAFKMELKREYKTPRNAWKTVKDAFCTPSIDAYHEKLFSYTGVLDENEKLALLQYEKQKSKDMAREQTGIGTTALTKTFERCSKCSELKEKLLYCPCHTVRYCSKQCQLDDFAFHKQYCPRKKDGKKAAKSKSEGGTV